MEVTEKDNKENTSLMCIMSSQDEPNRATYLIEYGVLFFTFFLFIYSIFIS